MINRSNGQRTVFIETRYDWFYGGLWLQLYRRCELSGYWNRKWTVMWGGFDELTDKNVVLYFLSPHDIFKLNIIYLPIFCTSMFNTPFYFQDILSENINVSVSIHNFWALVAFILYSFISSTVWKSFLFLLSFSKSSSYPFSFSFSLSLFASSSLWNWVFFLAYLHQTQPHFIYNR